MQNDVLAKTNKQQRIQMASKGENIEALIAKNEPEVIAKLIDYQYAKEHYEEWKTHEHGAVRYALACLGIFPETFKLTEEEFNDRYARAITGELTKKPFHLMMGW